MARFPDGHVFIYKPKRTRIEIEERELVMCRNCKHYRDGGYCPENHIYPTEDWFCADGERREDGAG